MKVSPARKAAFGVLFKIETERAFSSVLLPAAEAGLSNADRGLCHEIVLGTLRHQIYLDRVIDILSGRKKLDPAIRIILRIGLYQITKLEKIPDHSAVNESVELTVTAKKRSAKGLVNAVLRRAIREMPVLQFSDDVERISVETSHPRWMVERWSSTYGESEAEALCHANNKRAPLTFRPTERSGFQDLVESGNFTPSRYAPNSWEARAMTGALLEAADSGIIYFQDEASQMAANAIHVPDGGRFLDVCAAPGGKTALISRESPKASVFAGDLHFERVRSMRENSIRQGSHGVRFVQYDAADELPFPDAAFDSVLVDAPCSGTGTIRHNPELRYFLEPADISTLAEKQLKILVNASKLVRGGGLLVYSTCSLEPEENEHVRERFLEKCADMKPVGVRVPAEFRESGTFVRTFPHIHGLDGFFISAFRRD